MDHGGNLVRDRSYQVVGHLVAAKRAKVVVTTKGRKAGSGFGGGPVYVVGVKTGSGRAKVLTFPDGNTADQVAQRLVKRLRARGYEVSTRGIIDEVQRRVREDEIEKARDRAIRKAARRGRIG